MNPAGIAVAVGLAGVVLSSPEPPPNPAGLAPVATVSTAPARSPLPPPRPVRTAPVQPPKLSLDQMVCRDPRLEGTEKVTFAASGGCGIFEPVKVSRIAGIKLSTPATLTCPTARAFANWLTGIAQPAARTHLGSDIREVWVMGSYACRTRNSRPGARLSEHAFGRAVDIGGLTLADGRRITVLRNWGKGASGRFLREIRKRACGGFKTVLGPGSDRFHTDHFHFDTARRRSAWCK